MRIDVVESLAAQARLLGTWMPPAAVVHVGAGSGVGEMHAWRAWDVDRALLVDASESRLKWALRLADEHAGWRAQAAVVGSDSGEADFFEASNPAESGLLDPVRLQALWPNLRRTGGSRLPTTTLDALARDAAIDTVDGRLWLLVDALPAAQLLQGAGKLLAKASVLWARVLLSPEAASGAPAAGLAALRTLAEAHGFRLLAVAEANHPAVGEALFCREAGQRASGADAEEAALLRRTLADMQAERDALRHELDAAHARPAAPAADAATQADLQAQLAAQQQARDALERQVADQARREEQLRLELVRAQAQLSLLTDLLAKGSRL